MKKMGSSAIWLRYYEKLFEKKVLFLGFIQSIAKLSKNLYYHENFFNQKRKVEKKDTENNFIYNVNNI